ncbi:MAG: hypothetical protein IAE78_29755 [Myxococcus sp.]|nr:hypothetical protein [Myxococcus sp.]
MKLNSRVCAAMLVLAFGAGCSTTAAARLSSSVSNVNAVEREEVLVGSRLPVLMPESTIAFLPPSECRSLGAADSALADVSMIRNQCGVIMSELEMKAAASGFKVVSWQTLKPPVTGTSLELARALKIDALVEVDALSLAVVGAERSDELLVEFFGPDANQQMVPLVVSNAREKATSCRDAYAPKSAEQRQATLASASASVKLVTVNDGTVHWFFRKTLPANTSESGKQFINFKSDETLSVMGIVSGIVGVVRRPTPEDIVCRDFYRVREVTEVTPQSLAGSRFTLNANTVATSDAERAQQRALLRAIANDVITSLRKSQGLPVGEKAGR